MNSVLKGLLSAALLFSFQSFAVVEGYKYPFENIEDTQRFVHLNETLRCPKCQNQNLADSNSPVASDMREKIYELMQQGQSNDEITQYMVDRFGPFVRYKPMFNPENFLLWFGPGLMLLFGIMLLVAIRRQQNKKSIAPLSQDEENALNALKNKAEL